LYYILISGH